MKTYKEFLNEAAKYKPYNLLLSKNLFSGIAEIISNLKLFSKLEIPDSELYDKLIKSAINDGGWSSTKNEESTLLYAFLEAWSTLSKIKINKQLAQNILVEIQEIGKFNFMGTKKDKEKLDIDLEYTFSLCKKGYEFLYALLIYTHRLAMSYPFAFYKVIEKHFGKDIKNALKIQSACEYYISTNKISNVLAGLK